MEHSLQEYLRRQKTEKLEAFLKGLLEEKEPVRDTVLLVKEILKARYQEEKNKP